ncbi:hypothetical protein D9619_012578 [Psilocybe cf. subviscida]|uniref:Uncharacterized protein n=1 Tax=Psilocybe cf. subviscida TaxID=2480587 RepID=A0A8H5B804_9AGAR|nr:hypothetical protein D9619_012578 [Psilocybe cf. subviscida]
MALAFNLSQLIAPCDFVRRRGSGPPPPPPSRAQSQPAPTLQECPASDLLWTMAFLAELRASRKTKSVDSLLKTKDHPLVVYIVARLLWVDRGIEMARERDTSGFWRYLGVVVETWDG